MNENHAKQQLMAATPLTRTSHLRLDCVTRRISLFFLISCTSRTVHTRWYVR